MAKKVLATEEWVEERLAQGGGVGQVTLANLPAKTAIVVTKVNNAWPARPTNRTDIPVIWKGPDPSPAIGGTGMVNGVDMRFVTV